MDTITRAELLSLPVSICNWIILDDYFERAFFDEEVFRKILNDYYSEIPLYKIEQLFIRLHAEVDEEYFQMLLDYLFSIMGVMR